MKRLPVLVFFVGALSSPNLAGTQATTAQATATAVRYGANPAAGHTFTHDGVRLYYEVYGTGEPLLVVHGNGGSIADLGAQIAHFRKRYKVIAMDSRDQGKSADSPDALTYEKMTDDLAALLDHLKVGPVDVLGWSDGGIEALLLGIRHPAKVKKIVAMAANLNPTERCPFSGGARDDQVDDGRDSRGHQGHAAGPARVEGDRHDAHRAEHRRQGARKPSPRRRWSWPAITTSFATSTLSTSSTTSRTASWRYSRTRRT